ncbi:MAG: hypothetical protein ACRC9K_24145 [Afipia sp.]
MNLEHADDGGLPTVVLPCPPDQFRDFIAGLLGKAQTIEAFIGGPFEVAKADIENLYHLLGQRVASQNEATLIQFTVKIIYNDQSSVLLNSLDEFLSYNEVKPLVSTSVFLSWTYLIKFQNKLFPEKQIVAIGFETEKSMRYAKSGGPISVMARATIPISIRIEHTDRSWGADIEALMRGQLGLLRLPVNKSRAFVTDHSGKIGFLTASTAMALTMVGAYKVSTAFAELQLEKVEQIRKASPVGSPELMIRQMDFVANQLASGVWTQVSLFAVLLTLAVLIGCIVLGVTVSERAMLGSPSFVLLTAQAVRRKQEIESELRAGWVYFAATITGALMLGVLSNFAFYFVLRYLGMPS